MMLQYQVMPNYKDTKGIAIKGFLPMMLREFVREFDGDSFVSQSRFDAYATTSNYYK